MLDIQIIRDNPEMVKQASLNKKDSVDVDAILSLDEKRREIIKKAEALKGQRNTASKDIALLKKNKKDASEAIAKMKDVSDSIKKLDIELRELENELHILMSKVPNIPHETVKHGIGEEDNEIVEICGTAPKYDFDLLDHMEIGTNLGLFDFPRGAKITGSGFPIYTGTGALLERALINFMLETHVTKNNYKEIMPPLLINRESAFGTGQLPKSEEQMYYMPEDELFCIPTAEVPVTNYHRDEMLDVSSLPIKYCAYSACFRREAGSWGKDTRGFLRVHEFNKVELVKFVEGDNSYDELESLRTDAESILKALGLHYRVLNLCDADLSFASAKTYDLEVWAPGENKWLEVSSCSNFEEFQARRMNIRYRPKDGGKPKFVHTLNGSGLATARILVAILETYQTAEGTVKIPEVLQPFMRGMKEITKN